MKKIFVLTILACLAAAGYKFVATELKTNLAFNSKVASCVDVVSEKASSIINTCKKIVTGTGSFIKRPALPDTAGDNASVAAVTIYLKHGGVISGNLLKKTSDTYTVDWNGERFVVDNAQIKRVEYKTQKEVEWPYTHDVVIIKTNGIPVDGHIDNVGADAVTVSFSEGGGSVEMDVKRSNIDYLLFAPVCTKGSLDTEKHLRTLFPKMKMYKDGNITLFTDSHPVTVTTYRKTLRNFYSDLYLKFFKIFSGRKPARQCFVVAFDDFSDYVEYAVTDGVPGWVAIGYFSPLDKTLYMFNAFGERMEQMVFDVMVGKTGKSMDMIVAAIKSRVDSRYHVFVEGQVKEINDRFWDAYNLYKGELTDMTLSTLRHEFTHEILNNWGLQSIVLSRPAIDRNVMIARKKEFLETKDYRKKEELLMGLMRLKKQELEGVEMTSARSWLSEGMATYCATDPIGSVDEGWLFLYQENAAKNEVNPIEFLTDFRVGSFPGLCHKAALGSYAQSWALTSFLMARYPDRFMSYQIRMATQKPKDGEEELQWLLDAIGKDLQALEKEFASYMAGYGKREDPDVRRFMRYYQIWEGLS